VILHKLKKATKRHYPLEMSMPQD